MQTFWKTRINTILVTGQIISTRTQNCGYYFFQNIFSEWTNNLVLPGKPTKPGEGTVATCIKNLFEINMWMETNQRNLLHWKKQNFSKQNLLKNGMQWLSLRPLFFCLKFSPFYTLCFVPSGNFWHFHMMVQGRHAVQWTMRGWAQFKQDFTVTFPAGSLPWNQIGLIICILTLYRRGHWSVLAKWLFLRVCKCEHICTKIITHRHIVPL